MLGTVSGDTLNSVTEKSKLSLFREGKHADFVKKTTSTRCIIDKILIYWMHHTRDVSYESHWHFFYAL